MSLDLDSVRKLIDPVLRIGGVEGFVVATSDGLPLISSLTDKDLEEKVAALTAVLAEVGNRASLELGKGEAEWITVNAPDGSGVIYIKLGDIGYLAVLFGRETRLGVLLYTLRDIRKKVSSLT